MKKLIVVLLALAMVFSMTSMAFAMLAPSPSPSYSGGEVAPATEEATDANGDPVEVTVETLPSSDAAAKEIKSAKDAEDLVEKLDVEDAVVVVLAGTGYAVGDMAVLTPLDVKVKGDASKVDWPLTVDLKVSGVKADSVVVVLHKGANGWEVVPAKVTGAGKVQATFNSLSPVVVLVSNGEPSNTYDNCDRSSACPMSAFDDVDINEWYHDCVHYVLAEGIMVGRGETFGPEDSTKRGDFFLTLYRLAGSPTGAATASYSDMSAAPEYMVSAINWATEQGLATGDNGAIKARDFITRQEAFTVLYRYAQKLGKVGATYAVDLSGFEDVDTVSGWAKDAVTWGVASGLIQGYENKLFPKDNITRTQLAALLCRWETEIVK